MSKAVLTAWQAAAADDSDGGDKASTAVLRESVVAGDYGLVHELLTHAARLPADTERGLKAQLDWAFLFWWERGFKTDADADLMSQDLSKRVKELEAQISDQRKELANRRTVTAAAIGKTLSVDSDRCFAEAAQRIRRTAPLFREQESFVSAKCDTAASQTIKCGELQIRRVGETASSGCK